MAEFKIFYSWQSHDRASRNFVSGCLKKVARENITLVEVQRDTSGIPGSPHVETAIFDRISECDLFVADLTPFSISDDRKKAYPNSNVLIELGYAFSKLSEDRIIMLFNGDLCTQEMMPFDINHRRLTVFSCSPERKDNCKKDVISKINTTVRQLLSLEDAHARKKKEDGVILSHLLFQGIQTAWEWYIRHEIDEDTQEDFMPITDAQIARIEKVASILTTDQYQLIHRIFHLMKYSVVGTDDYSGFSFAIDLVNLCIEPLAVSYWSFFPKLPFEMLLTEEVLELYNKIAAGKDCLTFHPCRTISSGNTDKTVFSVADRHSEAYAADGHCLCRFDLEEDGTITGYQETPNYQGNFRYGKRHGEGTECYRFSWHDHSDLEITKQGLWIEDVFAEGTIYNVLLYRNAQEPEEYALVTDARNELMTLHSRGYYDFLNDYDDSGDCTRYFIADILQKNGQYEIADETIRPLCKALGGPAEAYCYDCKYTAERSEDPNDPI